MRTTDDPSTTPAKAPAKKAPPQAPSAPQEPEQADSLQVDPRAVQDALQAPEPLPEASMVYAADPVTLQAHLDALIASGGFPQSVSAAPDGGFWVLAVRMPE